ncbi:putative phospholipase/Carboxylesterase family protein [Pectobacterium atrosepticum SCRI1043]|uniref:Phospholipase/Carboxylesterase family protein n=1 Tax=Pectobacterium atrosepticum (strain SCRI 1043 / ATCC BAA-672) TaxID=218491 RepID=Q6D7P5_PECAS|nr:esterase [Pectobacterium atrosepticum]GKV86456.1 esterase [Pectobacterium carotovorum subsp. carotovorum]AIA70236.1 hydrolase [Pectobacterium atrosepticum]AIK13155.1 putative phospholipase/Carboxylesterase family protein [Pectobacterium atrosepticum]ATY90061.1 esterase [Pectobacterium atrosepticum]KFX16982.1 hydrolase [Pectobacterium atrosepticum]
MNQDYVVVQQPSEANRLILLFHGVGDTAAGMAQIGRYFAAALPQALVISIAGPFSTGYGDGRQWFSVQGVTEENRLSRIEANLPRFVDTVRHWQEQSGISAEQTVLVGFSQGSIMSLEALKSESSLAGHIIAFSGRFAVLPEKAFADVAVHLIHGEADGVIVVGHAHAAAHRFQELGTSFTLDIAPGVGHGIDEHMLKQALVYLK